jgi:hypothetical protein
MEFLFVMFRVISWIAFDFPQPNLFALRAQGGRGRPPSGA